MTLWGLSLKHIAKLTPKYLSDSSVNQNKIKVTVNSATFFEGLITWAYADMNQMPDVPIHIEASSVGYSQVAAITETQIDGTVTAEKVAQVIASKGGMTVTNHGVTANIDGFHAGGNAVIQLQELANSLRSQGVIVDIGYGTIDLWNSEKARDSSKITVSKSTGLIGYPMLTGYGLQFTTMFNPAMRLLQIVEVQTDLPNASGDWKVQYNTSHEISAWIDGGPWFTHVLAVSNEYDTSSQ